MNGLFENIKPYCSILKKCTSSDVGKWGEKDLDRAFRWADYFDKAMVGISKSRSITAKVDQKLKELGQTRGWKLGTKELNYTTFQQSSEYLIKSLVANPSLPRELKDKVHRKLKDKSNVEPMETVDLVCDKGEPSSLSRDQEHPPTHITEPSSLSHDQEHPPTHTTEPSSLSRDREHPPTHTTEPSSLSRDQEHPPTHTTVSILQQLQKERSFSVVCEQLEQLSSKNGAMDVILECVVECEGSYTDTKKVIVCWLVEKVKQSDYTSHPNCIWDRPPEVLAKISSLYLDFFKEHIKYLANEVEKQETLDISNIAFCNDTTTNIQSLKTVVSHFEALSSVSGEVFEVCVLFVRRQAAYHCTRGSRFSYSTPITTCAWTKVLHALRHDTLR